MECSSVDDTLLFKVLKTGKYNRIKKNLAEKRSGKFQKRHLESISTRTRSPRLQIPYLNAILLWHFRVVLVNLLKQWPQVDSICSPETYVQAKNPIIKMIE